MRLSSQLRRPNIVPLSLTMSVSVEPRSGLQAHHIDAALGQFVRQRAAAGAGADHDDD